MNNWWHRASRLWQPASRRMLLLLVLLVELGAFGQAVAPNRRLNFQPVASAGTCTAGTNILSILVVTNMSTTAGPINIYSNIVAWTPASNSTFVVDIATSPATDCTVTNTGTTQFTWNPVARTNYNTIASAANRLERWVAQMPQGTAPFSMRVVVTLASGTGINLHIFEIQGASQTAANGTNAVINTTARGTNASVGMAVVMPAALGNNGFNALIAAFADDSSSATDNAVGNSEVEVTETAYATPSTGLTVDARMTTTTTYATNSASSRDWAAIASEVVAGTNCLASQPGTLSAHNSIINATASCGNLTRFYGGQRAWVSAGETIKTLSFYMTDVFGDISGKSYTAKIWTLTGTSLNALQATSATVTGIATTQRGFVDFTFSTPFVSTSSTSYGFTIDSGSTDDSNYFLLGNCAGDTGLSGSFEMWASDKTFIIGGGDECALRIFTP